MTPWNAHDRFLKVISDPLYTQLVAIQDGLQRDSIAFWASRDVLFMHLPLTTRSVSSPMGLGSDSKPVQIDIAGIPCVTVQA